MGFMDTAYEQMDRETPFLQTSVFGSSMAQKQRAAEQAAHDRAMQRHSVMGPQKNSIRTSSKSGGSYGGAFMGGAPAVGAPVAGGAPMMGGYAMPEPQVIEQEKVDPWSKYRGGSGDRLAELSAGGDPSDFYRDKLQAMSSGEFTSADPSYQFRFAQGQKATERSLAAKGLLQSGNAAIELQDYGQQAASSEYGAQFDRMLQGMSGVSQQYDTQMQQLMKMSGVDVSPSEPWDLANRTRDSQTQQQQVANNYQVGMSEAAAKHTAANASARSSSSGGGGGAISWNMSV